MPEFVLDVPNLENPLTREFPAISTGKLEVLENVLFPVIVWLVFKVTKLDKFTPDKLFCTKAVVAICVLLVPVVAVGAVGVPVNVGLAKGAYVLDALLVVK